MKKIVWIIMAVVIVGGVIYYFTNEEKNGNEKEVIKIGVILPLTGELAPFGKKIINGINLAINDSNGNNNFKITLIIEDDKGQVNDAVSIINKFIEIDDIKIVIGTLTSGGTLGIAPIAQKNKVLLISPTASNPKLTDAGSFIYRIWSSDNLDAVIASEYCYKTLNLRKMAISYQNNDYCIGLKEIFKKKFIELGGEILIEDGYGEGERNYRTIISKLKEVKCDGVYLPGHPYGISSFLKQTRELSLNCVFFSNVAVEDKEFIKLAGLASNNLYYTAPAFDLNSPNNGITTFVKTYKDTYNEEPDIFGVKGFEVIQILAYAFKHNKTSPSEISNFIDSIKIFETIEGKLVFDNNGDVLTPISIKQYNNLKPIVIETIEPK